MAQMFEKMKKAVAEKDAQVKKLLDSNKRLEMSALKAENAKMEAGYAALGE